MTWVRSLGQEDPLEEKMATCSSILAWRIPWTGEPGGLQSMGSHLKKNLMWFILFVLLIEKSTQCTFRLLTLLSILYYKYVILGCHLPFSFVH